MINSNFLPEAFAVVDAIHHQLKKAAMKPKAIALLLWTMYSKGMRSWAHLARVHAHYNILPQWLRPNWKKV